MFEQTNRTYRKTSLLLRLWALVVLAGAIGGFALLPMPVPSEEPVKYEGLMVFYQPVIEAGSGLATLVAGLFGYVVAVTSAFLAVVLTYFATYALRRGDALRPVLLQLFAASSALVSLVVCGFVYRLPIFIGILWTLIPVVLIIGIGASVKRRNADFEFAQRKQMFGFENT